MYTSTHHPLSQDQIKHFAPSVFATQAHNRVTQRYQFISTLDMIGALEREGWLAVHAEESRVRIADREGFSKHLLRFRRFDQALPLVGDSFPEVVIVNSHDGSCSYQIHAGLFRLVCSNGMIIANADMGQVRRRHTGEALGEIIEGTYEIVEALPTIAGQVNTFQQIDLKPAEQQAFAESALSLRWDDGKALITPTQLLQARRLEDRSNDLWTTYQRVQENMLKGGQRGANSTGRRTTTRAVKSVDGNVKINKALWLLTERMAELKGA
jgi:hypothetical protein